MKTLTLLLALLSLVCHAQTQFGIPIATSTNCVAPSISGQPSSWTGITNSTPTLSVTASGTSLVFRWRTNDVDIGSIDSAFSGVASATLTIYNVTAATPTNYTVVITNDCGAITSSIATLTPTNGVPGGNGLLNNLAGAWLMEEADNVTRVDSSGNGHDLSNTGTVLQDISLFIQGASSAYSGTSSSRLRSADATFQATTKFTGMFWFRASSGQDSAWIMDRWGADNVWGVLGDSGTLAFLSRTGGGSPSVHSTVSVSSNLNKWGMCVYGFDSAGTGTNWISLNGETIQTVNALGTSMVSGADELTLFDLSGGSGAANGTIRIDAAAIWENRTLTQGDITALVGTFDFSAQTGTPLFFSGFTN